MREFQFATYQLRTTKVKLHKKGSRPYACHEGGVRHIYGGEWSDSHAGRFTTEKTDIGMHYR